MTKAFWALLLLCGTGCDRDVRLGLYLADATIEASVDADTGVDAAPQQTALLQFGDFVQTDCAGTLSDRADAFDGWSAATMGLVEGDIEAEWETNTLLRVSGSPIVESYQTTSMGLMANYVPEQPDNILVAIVTVTGSAPVGMTKDSAMLSVDLTTKTASRILGQTGFLYADSSGNDGSCSLLLNAELQFN